MDDVVKKLIQDMTLEEKAAQITGVDSKSLVDGDNRFLPENAEKHLRHGIGHVCGISYSLDAGAEEIRKLTGQIQKWIAENTRSKIPAIFHEESLAGLAAKGAPIFPHPVGLGSMWEPELVWRMTDSIRRYMRGIGAHQALSPVLDIIYDPRFGRNEEMYGEDPYLVAANACAFIEGLQGDDLKQGIVATTKHFAGHAMCEGGRNCSPVHIGPRELRDTALFPFEAAVKKAGVKSVMNAYHDIDGVPCAASLELLTEILREQWGFDGTVVSDYGSVERLISQHAVAEDKKQAALQALAAGLDVELPGAVCFAEPLVEAVREGIVPEELIDRALERVLSQKLRIGLLDPAGTQSQPQPADSPEAGRALAAEMARKSVVLLKNEQNLLPLKRESVKTIAVIGPGARSRRNLLGCYSYLSLNGNRLKGQDIEAIAQDAAGRGIPTVLECIRDRVPGAEVHYAEGCSLFDTNTDGIAQAVGAARGADVAVVVVGDRSAMFEGGTVGENIDRVSTALPGAQAELVRAVAATGTPVVLVLVGGRPLTLAEPVGLSRAVLEAWLPGEQGGEAIADALFGVFNPGGRLSVTLAKHQGQHPMTYRLGKINFHKEYLDSDMQPLFPFGHGLSYTAFEYSNLQITPEGLEGRGEITISLDVRNTGLMAGDEVVQLYLNDVVASIARPVKELKGYKRLTLAAGESKRVTFRLHTDQLAFHNAALKLAAETGEFAVMVGASSADIRLSGSFRLERGYKVGADRVYFSTVSVD